MTTMTIMRTKDDNKAWFVGLDGQIVSEIENEAIVDDGSAFDPERMIAVEIRAHAASHYSFDS